MSNTSIAPQVVVRNRITYWLTWGATLIFFGGFYSLLIPLPRYLTRVGLSDWQIGLVLGAFGVASLIGRPYAGLASDRWGARRVMVAGALALLVGSVAVPLTGNVILLFLLRLLQAISYVAFTTAGTALVITLSPPELRGQRLAIFGAAANVAITLVPALMSGMLAAAPLEWAFLIVGGLAFAAGILALQLRVPSTVHIAEQGQAPLLKQLGLPVLTTGLLGAGFVAFFQFIPIYAARRQGLPAELLYTFYGCGIIATRVLAGRLLDQRGIGRVIVLSAVILAVGLGLFALEPPPVGQVLAAVLVAVGTGLGHPALLAHHAALLPGAPGRASAAFYLGFDLGIGLGSLLFGVALQMGGLAGLYVTAALLSIAMLPLAPLLARQRK